MSLFKQILFFSPGSLSVHLSLYSDFFQFNLKLLNQMKVVYAGIVIDKRRFKLVLPVGNKLILLSLGGEGKGPRGN